MNTAVPVQLPSGRGPARVGQATAVEQSRAVAEVQASVLVAMQYPRDVQAAGRAMRDTCANPRLASRAFFAFPRGGQRVSGPSVYLARELARTWGNVSHGVAEMSRDDEHGQSEMQAFAWDLETNTRVATTFIVPHKRDKKGGPERLTEMRDIYENNANAGARRVRECIYSVLPLWFTDEAQEICAKTNEHGGGVPLPQRIAKALEVFGALGVTEDDLVRRLDRPTGKWSAQDLAQLQVLVGSLQRGEVRREEEFPPVTRVTAAEIRGDQPNGGLPLGTGPDEAAAIADEEPVPPAEVVPDAAKDTRQMFALLKKTGLDGDAKRDDQLAFLSGVAGRPIGSSSDLTAAEVKAVIGQLELTERAVPEDRALIVAEMVEHGRTLQGGSG